MKISIIVPVYNTAVYLDRCIESLVNQSYKDIEILLVNDGSTDNSRQVCTYWAGKDSRIKYIQQENSGLSAARNAGISASTGEWLCFVDSDDCVSPLFAEKLLSLATENGAEVAMCGYQLTDEFTPVELIGVPLALHHTEVLEPQQYFERLYTDKEILYVIACNKIYSAHIFDNLRFEDGKLHEDEGIIHKTIGLCNKIAVNYEPLYFYTMRRDSIMKTPQFRPANMDVLDFWAERIEYFTRMGWHSLVYLTMRNYLVKCLELYNRIDSETPEGDMYRKHLMAAYKNMLSQMEKCPVKSTKFILTMKYYSMFPKKFAGVDRGRFLFGGQ